MPLSAPAAFTERSGVKDIRVTHIVGQKLGPGRLLKLLLLWFHPALGKKLFLYSFPYSFRGVEILGDLIAEHQRDTYSHQKKYVVRENGLP